MSSAAPLPGNTGLVRVPDAIGARVVGITYGQIARLLYGTDDTAAIKRISAWRRTDPAFPPDLGRGRSPVFDAAQIWHWLAAKVADPDGRTRESVRAMTRLTNDAEAVSERHWLLGAVALRQEVPPHEARTWLAALVAVAQLSTRPVSADQRDGVLVVPTSQDAAALLANAADSTVTREEFAERVGQALPLIDARRAGHSIQPLRALAEVIVPTDLRALAADALSHTPPWSLPTRAELALDGEDSGGPVPARASTSARGAAHLVASVVARLVPDGDRGGLSAYDPAVGEGQVLAALAGVGIGRVIGRDSDLAALHIAAARLLATNAAMDLAWTENSLGPRQMPGPRADVVVVDPPQPGRRQRFEHEMGAWWRHALDHLADDGLAFVITSDQPSAQPPDDVITAGHLLAKADTGLRFRRDTSGRSVLWVLGHRTNPTVVRIAASGDASAGEQPDDIVALLAAAVADGVRAVRSGGVPQPRQGGPVLVDIVAATDAPAIRSRPQAYADDVWRQQFERFVDVLTALPVEPRRAILDTAIARLSEERRRVRTDEELEDARAAGIAAQADAVLGVPQLPRRTRP